MQTDGRILEEVLELAARALGEIAQGDVGERDREPLRHRRGVDAQPPIERHVVRVERDGHAFRERAAKLAIARGAHELGELQPEDLAEEPFTRAAELAEERVGGAVEIGEAPLAIDDDDRGVDAFEDRGELVAVLLDHAWIVETREPVSKTGKDFPYIARNN